MDQNERHLKFNLYITKPRTFPKRKVLFLYKLEYILTMKFSRIIFSVLLVFSIAFTMFFGYNKLTFQDAEVKPKDYKGILSMWHVDSFEGGSGSRKQFLLDTAIAFEKQNEGVLVMVTSLSAQGVKERLDKGECPDLISFGGGVEVKNMSELSCNDLSVGGKVGGEGYATAWCKGGYALIANAEKIDTIPNELTSLSVSQAEYTLPLVAFVLEGLTAQNIKVKAPLDAYIDFVNGKSDYFLGTQRDVVRLSNRGLNVVCRPMNAYNDLYQYISVTATDSEKNLYAQKFVSFLLSETVQKKLFKISMFSDFYQVDYQDGHLSNLSKIANERTISVFTPSIKLKELQSQSYLAVNGDSEALNKIKNMLV